jgi:hypothetical protein
VALYEEFFADQRRHAVYGDDLHTLSRASVTSCGPLRRHLSSRCSPHRNRRRHVARWASCRPGTASSSSRSSILR